MSIYNKVTWVNDSPPPINASNLNHLEDGVEAAHIEIASQAVEIASAIAYASTLSANIAANGSAIAANASAIWGNTNAIATLIAEDVLINSALNAQTAANASNTAAVASMLPVVATHTVQIAELYATQGYHSSQIGEILATQGALASQIAGVSASAGNHASVIAAIIATQAGIGATQTTHTNVLGQHATRIANLEGQVGNLLSSVGDSNRTGAGPVDLWDQAEPVGVTATSALPRAIGIRYTPSTDVGSSSGLAQVAVEMMANAGVASPTRQWSAAILNPAGTVIAWCAPTSVPSVATGLVVDTRSLPLSVNPSLMASGFLQAGAAYYVVLASDDLFRFSVLGAPAKGQAEAMVRHKRSLAYDWPLPSGLALASYGSFPIDGASGGPSSFAPQAYPATFFS